MMQYILSEEEMEEVRQLRAKMKRLPSVDKLQKMCTKIADEWPTFKGCDGTDEPIPWECILSVDYEHCCDECPVQNICPLEWKSWSK